MNEDDYQAIVKLVPPEYVRRVTEALARGEYDRQDEPPVLVAYHHEYDEPLCLVQAYDGRDWVALLVFMPRRAGADEHVWELVLDVLVSDKDDESAVAVELAWTLYYTVVDDAWHDLLPLVAQ